MKFRRHECWSCGRVWVSPVRLSRHTENVSGEAREYCPDCGKRADCSSPVFEKPDLDQSG